MKFSYPSGAKPLQGYTIKRGIGIGGFGEVYFALNDAGKEVALKKIQRNLDIELRGVRQCLNIRHVNLISLWDIQTSAAGESWVVMEYVPGPSLRDILEDHPRGLPEPLLKLWFTSIASGVAYLHHRGIVHRDLKPENVFRDDDAHVIKIGDYGLSKFISSSHQSGQTGTVGTVHYMAPEICKGDYGKEVDIYALGVTLYEMLTGEVPFDGETSQEILYKHLLDSPKLDAVPEQYRSVVEGCLVKEPDSRYSNVAALINDMPWSEFSSQSNAIMSLHSVGVFPQPDAPNVSTAAPASSNGSDFGELGAMIEPILISNQDAKSYTPAVVFGPVEEVLETDPATATEQDRLRQFRKTTPPSTGDFSQKRHAAARAKADQLADEPEKKLAKRTTVVGMDPGALFNVDADGNVRRVASGIVAQPKSPRVRRSQRRRIVAKRVARRYSSLAQRVAQSPMATPGKLGVLAVVGTAVLKSSMFASSLGILLTVISVAWALMRTWAGEAIFDFRPRSAAKRDEQYLQGQWLARRPIEDRAAEFLGELLVAALFCVGASACAGWLMQSGLSHDPLGQWCCFAWLGWTALAALWFLLSAEKWLSAKRIGYAIAGIATGIASAGLVSLFQIGPEMLPDGASWLTFLPLWVRLCCFFTLLFLGVTGFRTDPLRLSRMSLAQCGFAFAVAWLVANLLGLPGPLFGFLGCVIAAGLSLSAKWLGTSERNRVRRWLVSNAMDAQAR